MVRKSSTLLPAPPKGAVLLRRGRHFSLNAGDGFYEIRDARTGQEIAVFSDDAYLAAYNRFLELEHESSVFGFFTRIWHAALLRWDVTIGAAIAVIAVAILVLAATGGSDALQFWNQAPQSTPSVLSDLGRHPDWAPFVAPERDDPRTPNKPDKKGDNRPGRGGNGGPGGVGAPGPGGGTSTDQGGTKNDSNTNPGSDGGPKPGNETTPPPVQTTDPPPTDTSPPPPTDPTTDPTSPPATA